MKTNNFYHKLIESKLFWAVVSLLAALVFWSYVTSVESDEFTQVFRNVPVEIVGEDSLRNNRNLVITDVETSTVTVEITGPRRIVAALTYSDLTAQVDVSKLTQSTYTSQAYSIVFPDRTDTSSIQIVAKIPETVNFTVSQQTSKSITVKGSFNGETADGYSAEMPVFEPTTITVYGPEAYLKDISYAFVTFGADMTVDSTYSVDTGYTLMNEQGEECSSVGLTFSADTVTATLPILMVKSVPLEVNLIEGAGASAANTVVRIEPSAITLAGDSALLSGLNKITLATIDLKDFNSSFTDTFNILYDDTLKNLTGITEAEVEIEISGLETRAYSVSNISCINITEGYECDILTESLEVVIRGTPEILDNIKSENIRAVADIDDYKESTGIYMPAVKIYIDGFNDAGEIGDNTITIELRKVS